jgi:hypothetical protein
VALLANCASLDVFLFTTNIAFALGHAGKPARRKDERKLCAARTRGKRGTMRKEEAARHRGYFSRGQPDPAKTDAGMLHGVVAPTRGPDN